jgi:hypothetical protein
MKHLLFSLVLVAGLVPYAHATQSHKDCNPRPPKDPPVVSRPEPKAPSQSRSDTVDRPCARAEELKPVWCKWSK